MFERFTDRARRALVVAQKEARSFGHARIAPAHIVLALSGDDVSGMAERALTAAGVDTAALRARVASWMPTDPAIRAAENLPFSREAKKVLELALREALSLGDKHIGTEHLLLGALRLGATDPGIGELLGVPIGDVRGELRALMSGAHARPALSPALSAAMARARAVAGDAAMTTGQLLAAMLEDGDSHAARALGAVGAGKDTVGDALTRVPVAGTTDEAAAAQPVELKIDDVSITVTDRVLAAQLRSANPDDVVDALAAYFRRAASQGDGAEGEAVGA